MSHRLSAREATAVRSDEENSGDRVGGAKTIAGERSVPCAHLQAGGEADILALD